MSYQGWTNWETWHTSLLIDNEYDIYLKKVELVKSKASLNTFKRGLMKAEVMTKRFHKQNFPGEKFDKVNWKEIYTSAMEEEYD